MKPTVLAANQNSPAGGGGGNGNASNAGAGISIPISREYGGNGASPQQHYPQQSPYNSQPAYGSPRQQQSQPYQQYQQVPTNQQHFQPNFGFEPDMDMDMDNMFPRTRLGRMNPFATFGGTRKRNSLHDPHTQSHPQARSMHADEDFSHYFGDAADFGFPQFSTMGRRGRETGGASNHLEHDDDFFNRLPSEFRQYMPEGFGARRTTSNNLPQHPTHPQSQAHPQQYPPQQQYCQQDYGMPHQVQHVPQSPSKRLCDAAIQTEDSVGRSEVDCASPNLNQHGLRNTMDLGVKSAAEQEQALRSHSAPPPEQQQLNQPSQPGTQTSPTVQPQQPPQFHKTYYAPKSHPQQKQQTPPPPQTPGGSFVRTIPIFVEGRTEPIINAHKEIPNQNAAPDAQTQASAQTFYAPQQQQSQQQQERPGPLNTQQQPDEQSVQADAGVGILPQTPHTVDSIKKIQDIQRDVLELMAQVEQFKGTRQDKEYAYLDEMLTRNLLKLDTIDTNGKDSIRLARKEAIKCIQASVNVLDAKAEENGRIAGATETDPNAAETSSTTAEGNETTSADKTTIVVAAEAPSTPQPLDVTKIQEAIPLPPPPNAAEATNLQRASTNESATTITLTEAFE